MEREIVFEVLAEGGSISIERAENPEIGFDYFLKTQEAEIFEDETPINQTNVLIISMNLLTQSINNMLGINCI